MRIRALGANRRAVYRLAPDLLLVFKPRGHREAEHAHPQRQRLRVLRGRLAVRLGTRRVILEPGSRALVLAAGRTHDTLALRATWLVAESLP
jgi:quercetin dioxygenase-like cupin family protein